jgi:DNA-binding CsgD family transcriptional regulator
MDSLSPREREVLHWIAQGKRNKEIGLILGTSVFTVNTQVEAILRKLDVETRGAAAIVWMKSEA